MLIASNCVYLHGIPGSPDELLLFEGGQQAVRGSIIAPNRTLNNGVLSVSNYLDALSHSVADARPGQSLTLIGFSLGTKTALELAICLGERVDHIHLISPAAPLESGYYLPDMAGGAVFKLAIRTRMIFRILSFVQSTICRVAPGLLFEGIFAKAAGADKSIAACPDFQAGLASILRANLLGGATNYQREIIDYVEPWASVLDRVHQPVTIWSGDVDNWTPPAMTNALQALLPNVKTVHRLTGLSHYSTLEAALSQLDFR